MNKAIEAYKTESTYRPGLAKLMLEMEADLKAKTAANEALFSANSELMKANKKINAAHVLLKERICALGLLLLALGVGFCMALAA